MRAVLGLALGLTVQAMAAMAQTAPPRTGAETRPAPAESGRSPGPPLDQGPAAPEADRAHRGGGAVLEGAPGAPAPPPQPTPPLPGR